MSKIKLFIALCENKRIFFDCDGRIYEPSPTINRYMPTEKFVFYECFGKPILLFQPEYLSVGFYAPEDDFKYEIIL